MLRLDGVVKKFGDKRAVDQRLARRARRASCVGVIGRSGAGKSTLLRMINRLGDPQPAAASCFDGTDVTALKGRALRALAGALRHDLPAVQPGRPRSTC